MTIYIEFFLLYKIVSLFVSVVIYKAFTFEVISKRGLFIFLFIPICFYLSITIKLFSLIAVALVFFIFNGSIYAKIKKTFCIMIIFFLLTGFFYVLPLNSNECFLLTSFLEIVLAVILINFGKERDLEIFYPITFKLKKQTIRLKAFLDTGFTASYKDKPLILLAKKYQIFDETNDYITIHTANGDLELACYYVKRLMLKGKIISCYIAFGLIEYDAIISYSVLG